MEMFTSPIEPAKWFDRTFFCKKTCISQDFSRTLQRLFENSNYGYHHEAN